MASSRDPVAARRSLAVPLAPSSGTPPIRGVPNIGRSAPSKHKTETTGGPERASNLKAWKRNGGVGVTTFGGLRALDISRDITLAMLVVDEAHYVKNPDALRSQSVARIIPQADRTIFLTGTPMENRVEEFKNLVAYLQPHLISQIGGAHAIVGASAFRKSVAPVYLRRNQEDVLAELPPLVKVDEWEEFEKRALEG